MNKFSTRVISLSKSRGIPIRKLCIKVGMSESGFYHSLKKNTLKVETLLKISEILDVSVSTLLETNTHVFSENEKLLITSALIKNKVPDELVKKIYDLLKP